MRNNQSLRESYDEYLVILCGLLLECVLGKKDIIVFTLLFFAVIPIALWCWVYFLFASIALCIVTTVVLIFIVYPVLWHFAQARSKVR